MNGGDELSLKDITFLRAIRDINESPERYASTEAGVTPATVTAITEATTLTADEVAYRLDHPRLGKSGLVKVYEAGPPGDDSAGLNSAKLTEAGEAALADAEERQASVDAQDWQPDESQSEFDDVQEWEPAEVENNAGANVAASDGGSGAVVTESPSVSEPATPATTAQSEPVQTVSADDGTVRVDEERLSALESRLDELETQQAESTPEPGPAAAAEPERVEALEEELAALRETTESLETSLETAVSTVEELNDAEYGALDEKREEQFQTAVKSMVAFHQLATEVLDVRVENYEPTAGHPEAERVEITRNRIGDALGVGHSGGGGGGMTLSGGDSNWPSPEEGGGGRLFNGGDDDTKPEPESDAPDSGVYPPLGENDDDSPREVADDADPEPESDAPESGVYPPLGSNEQDGENESAPEDGTGSNAPESGVYPPLGSNEERDGEASTAASESAPSADESGPSALGVDVDVDEPTGENIRETASEEGHVMEPIRSTGGEELPLSVTPGTLLSLHEVIVAADGNDESDDDTIETDDATHAAHLDPETARRVWSATVAAEDVESASAALPAVPMDTDPSPAGGDDD